MSLLRLTALSLIVIGLIYLPGLLAFARVAAPERSTGSLIHNTDGQPIGSRLVAQSFTSDRYFHPRPSAAEYDGIGAVGSNLSPTHPALADRAREIIAATGATSDNPIPADLVTASGSGLDPDITLAAARFQAPRVAAARNLPLEEVETLILQTSRPLMGPLGGPELLNVLELNLALDRL